jgi:hypothetical protein
MRRTNIYLDDDQTERLDQRAAQEGVSRAELIRRLLDDALAGTDHDLAVDVDAIRTSFGALADAAPVDRAHDARGDHLDRMWRLGA